ncbi:MAG: pyridoxamine kinase [Lachnospiraceae bacterium]|nr:pyridoxamine kinase [Lachnospiraceae bacterium]MDY4095657.1 pyridoxamine kinase [Lachnospiraceae bacterium]
MERIALINDLSGFGKCSLTVAIPVISVMGMQACPLPTAVLSAQTGFAEYFCDDYTDRMDEFTRQWKNMGVSFDGIYSGYLAGAGQVEKVLLFLEQFKRQDTLYLADPVMGDNGKTIRIFNDGLLREMKELTRQANVITPNLTEACLLADEDYESLTSYSRREDYLERIRDMGERLIARAREKQQVIVTGILRQQDDQQMIGNLAISEKETSYVETLYTGKSFSGTGDLFSSVVCGCMVKKMAVKEAMEKAVDFLQNAIEEASKEHIPTNHGVHFEHYLSRLLLP